MFTKTETATILLFPEVDALEALTTALYDVIGEFEGKVSVCEMLGILRLLSDEISEEARSDD